MPFTFFAHQLPVIPLKWALPRWFDGTALCVGSMAPDLAYAFVGSPLAFASHTLRAQLVWSVPLTFALTLLFRTRMAEPIGSQLPGPLGLELRALAHSRPAWFVTCWSALVGGLSHVMLDGFTHYDGWAVRHYGALRAVLFELAGRKVHVWSVLQYLGHSLGTLLGLLLMAALVRRRQVSRWNGVELQPLAAPSPAAAAFWRACSASLLLASLAAMSGGSLPVAIIRAALAGFAGLAVAVLSMPSAPSTGSGQRELH